MSTKLMPWPDGVHPDEPSGPFRDGKLEFKICKISQLPILLDPRCNLIDHNDLRDYYKSFLLGERGSVVVGNENTPINRILNGKKRLADLYEMCLTHLMDFYFESEDDNGFIDVLNDGLADYDKHSFEVEFITSILNEGLLELNRLKGIRRRGRTDDEAKEFVEGYFFMWKYWINKAKSLNF